MSDPFAVLDDEEREALRRGEQPEWTGPMLAKLSHERFSDPGWIFERKLDGERCLAFSSGGAVRLMSRNRKPLGASYPEIAEALCRQDCDDFVVDGEIVAFSGGVTSFERLQSRMQIHDPDQARATGVAVYYYLFDVIHMAGYATDRLPQRTRKTLLKGAFDFADPLRFLPHRNRDGEAYWAEACRKGWEGIIAKDASARYVHSRSGKWLKLKCVQRQELVIGGFTDAEGERIGFGALLLGYHDGDALVYAGKVGTGFDDDTLRRLRKRLGTRTRKTTPFDRGRPPSGGVHWVTPELVAEVGFTEWTADGRLRHPRFLGLRRDKDAAQVVRE